MALFIFRRPCWKNSLCWKRIECATRFLRRYNVREDQFSKATSAKSFIVSIYELNLIDFFKEPSNFFTWVIYSRYVCREKIDNVTWDLCYCNNLSSLFYPRREKRYLSTASICEPFVALAEHNNWLIYSCRSRLILTFLRAKIRGLSLE